MSSSGVEVMLAQQFQANRLMVRSPALSFVVCVLSLTSGCANEYDAPAGKLQRSHIRTLLTLYVSCQQSLGRLPRDEAEFRVFINEKGGAVLNRLDISSVDELFFSERDGKPLVVNYDSVGSDIVIYEQEGIDGVRQVGYSLGMIREVDDAEFATLVPQQ